MIKYLCLIILSLNLSACASVSNDASAQECKAEVLDQNLDNLSNIEELWGKLCQ